MDKAIYKLPYGTGSIQVSLSPDRVNGTIEDKVKFPGRPVTAQEEYWEVLRALRQPYGHLPLADALRGKEKIVILVSDDTRPVPTPLLIKAIIAEGSVVGIPPDKFSIVVARGGHPSKGRLQEDAYLPGEFIESIPLFESGEEGYLLVGQTKLGTPVEIDKRVAEADFVIATGNIEMHRLAGFSGGAKALMPGVGSRASIQANHSLIEKFQPSAGVLQDNLIRQDLEEAAEICGVKYIFNVIVDRHKRVIKAVAGDKIQAHRKGCKVAKLIQEVVVDQSSELVVASAGGTPKDSSLYQVVKSLLNAAKVIQPGGYIIMYAQCTDGIGDTHFAQLLGQVQTLEELKTILQQEFVLGYHKAQGLVELWEKCNFYLVTDQLDELPLLRVCRPEDAQALIDRLLTKVSQEYKIWVLPSAGYVFPISS